MIDFNGYNATMRRGDSETISVSGTGLFASGDKLYLTLREQVHNNIVIQKIVNYDDLVDGKAVFSFSQSDTQGMDESTLVWDMEMKKAGGQCFHIIPPNATDSIPTWTFKGDVTR